MIRLMIVDDELLMIDGMAAMLSDQSDIAVVARVTDAAEVMDAAARTNPDIIVLDVLMRTGEGRVLAAQLRKAYPNLRILGCSTSLAPRVIEEMLKAGATGYITKGEPEGEFETAIRHIVKTPTVFLSRRTVEALSDPALSIESLTPREREILGCLCRDVIPKQVAGQLGLKVKTVYNHIERIRIKAGVNNMIQLYPIAVREGIVEMPG
jgi:DNA-binding NarL/FixJ family response regulator